MAQRAPTKTVVLQSLLALHLVRGMAETAATSGAATAGSAPAAPAVFTTEIPGLKEGVPIMVGVAPQETDDSCKLELRGDRKESVLSSADLPLVMAAIREEIDAWNEDHPEQQFNDSEVDGAIMLAIVETKYAKTRLEPLMLWGADGTTKLCSRDEVNHRPQQGVVLKYCIIFLKRGFMPSCRGRVIARPITDGSGSEIAFKIIGGATVIEAIYMAASLHPQNRFVQLIRATGIPNVLQIDESTMPVVRHFIKHEHNNWHVTGGKTIGEHLDTCVLAMEHWAKKRKKDGISKQSLPATGPMSYEAVYKWEITKEFSEVFGEWEYYDYMKCWVNKCIKWNCFETCRGWFEEKGDFLHPALRNREVISHLQKLGICLEQIEDVWSGETLAMVMMVSLKFAFPTIKGDVHELQHLAEGSESDDQPDWVMRGAFRTEKSSEAMVQDFLCAPMSGSVTFKKPKVAPKAKTAKDKKAEAKAGREKKAAKKAPKKKADSADTATETTEATEATVKTEAKEGGETAESAGTAAEIASEAKTADEQSDPEDLSITLKTGHTTRECMALDRLLQCIFKLMGKIMSPEAIPACPGFACHVERGLEAIYKGSTNINGKDLSEYSKALDGLRMVIIKDNQQALKRNLTIDDSKSSSEVADIIINQLKQEEAAAAVQRTDSWVDRCASAKSLGQLVYDLDFALAFGTFTRQALNGAWNDGMIGWTWRSCSSILSTSYLHPVSIPPYRSTRCSSCSSSRCRPGLPSGRVRA